MDCTGQAYDGASNMSGRLSGVQAKISADYPKAIYVHPLFMSFSFFSSFFFIIIFFYVEPNQCNA